MQQTKMRFFQTVTLGKPLKILFRQNNYEKFFENGNTIHLLLSKEE